MKYLWITVLTVLLAGPAFGQGGPNQFGMLDNMKAANEAYRQLYNSFTPEQNCTQEADSSLAYRKCCFRITRGKSLGSISYFFR